MNETPKKNAGYLSQAGLVILLALLYGGALAGVQTTLRPMIEKNKWEETKRQIPALVGMASPLSEADQDKLSIEKREIQDSQGKKQLAYLAHFDGQPKGWVLPAGGTGFADRIELLIGLDPHAETILGLYVLDQKETPGLGDLIRGEPFRGQFRDKPTDEPLTVGIAAKQIQPLSGATISSQSVAQIVNEAITRFKEPLRRESLEPTSNTTEP